MANCMKQDPWIKTSSVLSFRRLSYFEAKFQPRRALVARQLTRYARDASGDAGPVGMAGLLSTVGSSGGMT